MQQRISACLTLVHRDVFYTAVFIRFLFVRGVILSSRFLVLHDEALSM